MTVMNLIFFICFFFVLLVLILIFVFELLLYWVTSSKVQECRDCGIDMYSSARVLECQKVPVSTQVLS
jgi:hypothetical protein